MGKTDFGRIIKEQQFTEHTLDKLLFGYDDQTQFRSYKTLQCQSCGEEVSVKRGSHARLDEGKEGNAL